MSEHRPMALHVFSRGPHSLGLARNAGEPSAWTWLRRGLGRRVVERFLRAFAAI